MSNQEVDTLILKNWADLDVAVSRADQIETEVFVAFQELVSSWCSGRGWNGAFKAPDDLWISPSHWIIESGKRPKAKAKFELNFLKADKNWWCLTSMMGLGEGGMIFRLVPAEVTREWKASITSGARALDLPGFKVDDTPSFTLPVRVELEALTQGLASGSYRDALAPVLEILDQLEAAVPVVDGLLDNATGPN